jgi:hypothetical protein
VPENSKYCHYFKDLNFTERLQTSLSAIARERDPYMATAGHFFVQKYIRQEFSQWGSVEIHTFEVRGKAFATHLVF